MKPWYETTRRWGQTNLTESDPLSFDFDFWQNQWKRTRIQGVIVNCGGIVAFYPSRFPLQHRAMGIERRDFLGEFIAAARDAGLAVIARMDINRAKQDFYDAHPDWFCVDKNGTPIMAQGRYVSCVNGPYYSKYIPAVLREVIERYHPEGFADNNWKGLGRNTICYCVNCRRLFKEYAGMELPPAVNWEDPAYLAWVRWGTQRRTEVWDFFNAVTREHGGADCIWAGMLPSDPHNLSGGLADIYAICQRAKIIFCDHQARNKQNGFENNGTTGALLRLAAHENILVPESMANYVAGERAFRISANPVPETRMWMLDGIAGGISPWYHHIGGHLHDRRQFETPVPVFNWHVKNEEFLYDREDLAEIGLVWSQANADFYGRGQAYEKTALPWRGYTKALTRARLPYLPIHAADIKKYAQRLKTLILPHVAILREDELDAVCAFAENGGGLVFSGETAGRGPDGAALTHNRLWELTGLRPTGETLGAPNPSQLSWEQYDAHNYLLLPPERHPILSAFHDTRILPLGGELRVTETAGLLQPILGFVPSFPIFPPEFSYIRQECPETAGLLAGTLKSGARVAYLAADLDRCLGRYGLPDQARLLAETVLWTMRSEKRLTVEGPGYLDCRIYRQRDKLIIHIVNLSGCNAAGFCEETYPVGPVTVTAAAEGFAFTRALLTAAGTEIPIAPGKTVQIKLDTVGQHEMIVLCP